MSQMSETPDISHAAAASEPQPHPIGLVVADDLARNRLTVFFRLLLALPHYLFLSLWGIAVVFAVLAAWFAALFTGRVPDGLHGFIAAYVRYMTRVAAYALLLADPFPPFGSGGSYPIDLRVDPAREQGRLGVFFRLLLAIPALIIADVLWNLSAVLAFLGWFYALATGRMHEGIRNLGAWLLRYEMQTTAYTALLTNRYPSLSGVPTP